MKNFDLPFLPNRTEKPRESGVSMVMDKGLSLRGAEDLIESAGHLTDLVKLGFGSSLITSNLKEKIDLYQNAGLKVYFGGTLFEAFYARDMVDDYMKLVDSYGLSTVEISDGSIKMNPDDKCELIQKFAKNFTTLSEVGSKNDSIIISPNHWITMMNREIEAGAWKVIAEARESGTVGIYKSNGKAHTVLINKILSKVPKDKILWEAPKKAQQVFFIDLLGADVNLGNIAPNEIIPCECLRLGLRGDTFFNYMPEEITNVLKHS